MIHPHNLSISGVLFFVLIFQNVVSQNLTSSKTEYNELSFLENKGQISDQYFEPRADVLFAGELNGIQYFLRDKGISYQFIEDSRTIQKTNSKVNGFVTSIESVLNIYRIDINWIGINKKFTIETGSTLEGSSNYYLPSCPKGIIDVKSYQSIKYVDLYEGVDVVWYNNNGNLEYDYIVAPWVDYSIIKWSVEGAQKLFIDTLGRLVIETPFGTVKEDPPNAFQGTKKKEINWRITNNTVGFLIQDYDPSLLLVIDPIVRLWGTYFGSIGLEEASDGELDGNSNIYIVGNSSSIQSIATTGSFQTTLSGSRDAYLAKFNSSGARVWCTYFGGASADQATSCAIDPVGNVYMTGYTSSIANLTFATQGCHQSTFGGSLDAFLVKFDENGIRKWATYYGGVDTDRSFDCAVDNAYNIVLCGETTSFTSISTPGSHQSSLRAFYDAFIVKFDSAGTRLWGTYYGGFDNDAGSSLACDGSSNIYMAGSTESTSYISTSGAHQSLNGGQKDAFLIKFNANGVRQWGTYYGGSANDNTADCKSDDLFNIYLVGGTSSINQISTVGSHQSAIGGLSDAYLAKFDSNGIRLWGTYVGGTGDDNGCSCSIDKNGNTYLTGQTSSTSSIASLDAYQPNISGGNTDAFINKFDISGLRVWGSYFGGNSEDIGSSIQTGIGSNLYLIGNTRSTNGIATPSGHQLLQGGDVDAFLVRLVECDTNVTFDTIVACDSVLSPSGKYVWYSSGVYSDTMINFSGCDSLISINLTILQPPTISPGWNEVKCDPGSHSIYVFKSKGIVYWYDSFNSILAIDTGNTLTIPYLDSTRTYFAETKDNGCVSDRIPVQAIVLYTDTIEYDTTVCVSYMAPDSSILSTSGLHIVYLKKQSGCDSVFVINLTVLPVNVDVTILSSMLTSKADSAEYQWIDCNNGSVPINGEIVKSFVPITNGKYAVVVSQNNCTDTSICIDFTWIGIKNKNSLDGFTLFPNPTNGQFTIDLGEKYSDISVSIFNSQGQVMSKKTYQSIQTIEHKIEGTQGIYLVKVEYSEGKSTSFKIIKQ